MSSYFIDSLSLGDFHNYHGCFEALFCKNGQLFIPASTSHIKCDLVSSYLEATLESVEGGITSSKTQIIFIFHNERRQDIR